MFRPPGLMACRQPILPAPALRFGRRGECRFPGMVSIIPIRQDISRKRTWQTARAQCDNSSRGVWNSTTPQADSVDLSELTFDRLQPTDQDYKCQFRKTFGKFVMREAILDEEYWTAAWLRAESHWEDQAYGRYIESHKRKFAEQEFNALKRRCFGRHGHSLKCFCFVAVKKEDRNIRRTVLSSVVGTLDLSLRQLLQGETFPGEQVRTSMYASSSNSGRPPRYAYVANVCVAKYARRQGIASNMLQLAVEAAKSCGVKEIFVHVKTDNKAAQQLYRKTGFEMVEAAAAKLSMQQHQLLCFNTEPKFCV